MYGVSGRRRAGDIFALFVCYFVVIFKDPPAPPSDANLGYIPNVARKNPHRQPKCDAKIRLCFPESQPTRRAILTGFLSLRFRRLELLMAAAVPPARCSDGDCPCKLTRKELFAAKKERVTAYMTENQTLRFPLKDTLPDVFPDNGIDIVYYDPAMGWCCIGKMCGHPIELHPEGSPRRFSRSSSGLSTESGGSRDKVRSAESVGSDDNAVGPFSRAPGPDRTLFFLPPPERRRHPIYFFQARVYCVCILDSLTTTLQLRSQKFGDPVTPPNLMAMMLLLLRSRRVAFPDADS